MYVERRQTDKIVTAWPLRHKGGERPENKNKLKAAVSTYFDEKFRLYQACTTCW